MTAHCQRVDFRRQSQTTSMTNVVTLQEVVKKFIISQQILGRTFVFSIAEGCCQTRDIRENLGILCYIREYQGEKRFFKDQGNQCSHIPVATSLISMTKEIK